MIFSSFISSELGQRMRRVFSAQMLNQLTTIAVQFGLVPVLLIAWGKETYGVWLLLSAVPSYLTFSDLGFTLIAKNEMLMHVSAGRKEAALCTFHSVFRLLNLVVPSVLAIMVALLFSVDPAAWLNLGGFPTWQARLSILMLLANVLAYQYFLLICGGVRCENRVAAEATWGAVARLMEGVLVGIVAVCGGGLVLAAAATLANRLIFCVVLYVWLRRASPWLDLGHRLASKDEIRRLMKPAFAFMLLPISQAMLVQGPVIILGNLLGPIAVVTFSTTRTLTRFGTAASNMLNGTLMGEYATAFGRRDGTALRRLFRYHQLLSAAMIAAYGLFLFLFQGPLLGFYTHGKVSLIEPFSTLMIGVIAAEMMWSSVATPLEATNRHVQFAHLLVLICCVGMAVCYGMTVWLSLTGMALALLTIHGATFLACLGLRRNIALPANGTAALVSHAT